MCGIGAYVGKIDEAAEIKIKLLHSLLSNRGEDGAGISYMDTEGKISYTKESGSSVKLVEDYFFDIKNTPYGCITLHSRKSSVGANIKDNAHPFLFGMYNKENSNKSKNKNRNRNKNKKDNIANIEEKKYFNFSLVHNGTIKNWKELFTKYNSNNLVKETDFTVDSKALGFILYNNWSKAPEILKDYVGGAALICSSKDKIMFFRGESKDSPYSKVISEERPLYYSITENGIWAASEKSYLLTIRCDEKSIIEVPENKILIYDIHTYKLIEEIPVNRSESLQTDYGMTPVKTGPPSHSSHNNYGYSWGGNDWSGSKPENPKKYNVPKISLTVEEEMEYSFNSPVYFSTGSDAFVAYCSLNLESFIISDEGRPLIPLREWNNLTMKEREVLLNAASGAVNNDVNFDHYYNSIDMYINKNNIHQLSLIF